MKHQSPVRDYMLWLARSRGLAYADYYEEVFNRWMRIYGPEIAGPFSQYGIYDRARGFYAIKPMTQQAYDTALKITATHGALPTFHAFWSRIGCEFDGKDQTVCYIRGKKYAFFGKRERSRFLEFCLFYAILSSTFSFDAVYAGVGRIMSENTTP